MAKTSGLGDNLYVGGFDVSGDIGSLSKIHGGNKPIEVTGIDKLAFERIGGQRDGSIEFTSFFNPTAGQEHAVFSTLPTGDVVVTYARGTTLGNGGAAMLAKQVNYDAKRDKDGNLTFDVAAVPNGFGLEWGTQLTAGKRTDTTATSPSTGVDFGGATSFGWQAYLQVFAFTGTSVTVTLQDSADNSTFAGFSGSAFTAATGVTTQRLAGGPTDTVRQYVRAITTGTFSNAVFSVLFVKNSVSTVF